MAIRELNKYIVIKRMDVNNCLTGEDRIELDRILRKIQRWRTSTGRNAVNEYVVINRDEPYADAMWDIIIAFENEKEKRGEKA